MALSIFDLKNLHKINVLAEDFDNQLKIMVRDCRERPGLTKDRKMQLTVAVRPHPQHPDDVIVDLQTNCKIPNRVVDDFRMNTTVNDGLKFSHSSPGEPDQGCLDFDGES